MVNRPWEGWEEIGLRPRHLGAAKALALSTRHFRMSTCRAMWGALLKHSCPHHPAGNFPLPHCAILSHRHATYKDVGRCTKLMSLWWLWGLKYLTCFSLPLSFLSSPHSCHRHSHFVSLAISFSLFFHLGFFPYVTLSTMWNLARFPSLTCSSHSRAYMNVSGTVSRYCVWLWV